MENQSIYLIINFLKFKNGGIMMIVTTTNCIEGKKVLEYKGIVFGEVISGVDAIKDIAAGFTNFFGGRSKSYEGELIQAREEALEELKNRAYAVGANAVIGIDIDYEVLGQGGEYAHGNCFRNSSSS